MDIQASAWDEPNVEKEYIRNNSRVFLQLYRMLWAECTPHIVSLRSELEAASNQIKTADEEAPSFLDTLGLTRSILSQPGIKKKTAYDNGFGKLVNMNAVIEGKNFRIRPTYKECLEHYFAIYYQIKRSFKGTRQSLQLLTNKIFDGIEQLLTVAGFGVPREEAYVFFVVDIPSSNSRERYFVAYDPCKVVNKSELENDGSFISNMFDPETTAKIPGEGANIDSNGTCSSPVNHRTRSGQASKTFYEFKRSVDKPTVWRDILVTEVVDGNSPFWTEMCERSINIPELTSNVAIIRVMSKEDVPRCSALLGVVYKTTEENQVSAVYSYPWIFRYLQMLNQPLAEFVDKHHHNSEFLDWYHTDWEKQLMMVSGHGVELIRNIALSGDSSVQFRAIFQTQGLIQAVVRIYILGRRSFDESAEEAATNYARASLFDGRSLLDFSCNADDKIEILKNQIIDLVKEIYKARKIEDLVKLEDSNIKVELEGLNDFIFPRHILMYLLAELFINAKKNRWHPMIEDEIPVMNLVGVRVSVNEYKKLVIAVSGTGPHMDNTIVHAIEDESPDRPKEGSVSGLGLIKKLWPAVLGLKVQFKAESFQANNILDAFRSDDMYLNTISIAFEIPNADIEH